MFLFVPNLIGAPPHLLRALPPLPLPPAAPHPSPVPSAQPPHTIPGYARVAAAIYAFGVALSDPAATVLAYFASFVCDELDGRFARKFGQSSTFGAGEGRISGVQQPHTQKGADSSVGSSCSRCRPGAARWHPCPPQPPPNRRSASCQLLALLRS